MMNDLLFIKIILFSICFGWVYVEKLTENYGLLDFIPQYYPIFLKSLLSCSYCVAGWTALILVAIIDFSILGFPYIITAPFFSMAGVQILKK